MKNCPSCNGRKTTHNPSTHDDNPCRICHGKGEVPEPTAPIQVMSPLEFLNLQEKKKKKPNLERVNHALEIINYQLRQGNLEINFDSGVYTQVFGTDPDEKCLNLEEVTRSLRAQGWSVEEVSQQNSFLFKLKAPTYR